MWISKTQSWALLVFSKVTFTKTAIKPKFVQWTRNSGDFIVHWSIAALKVFKENLSANFGLIAVFVKVALEITKRAQQCVWLIRMLSCLIEIAQVYLRLVGCRMHKGHVQNEWVIKTFRKHPKGSKFVCTKSSLHFIHNLYLLLEIQRYLESPRIDFCETSYNRRQAPKVYVA